MKVCLLARGFNLSRGGLGRVAMELRDGLKAQGCEVKTLSVGKDGLLSYLWYSLVGCSINLPVADVYHAITPVEGALLPKRESVVTFHDLFLLTNKDRCGAGLGYNPVLRELAQVYFLWCCNMAKRCSHVVCVSEATRAEVIDILKVKPEKTRVIRSGIRPDLEPAPKPDGKLRVGYLGQLDRRKRLPLAIQALKSAPSLDIEFVIGGIGRDEGRLKAMAGEDERIRFLGLVPDDRLVDFYNSLDWLVFPTGIEGYGLPLVEAMACKRPAVVMEDAVIPQDVKSRCLITESLEEFFAHIQDIKVTGLEDNYRFAKEHTWQGCVEQYIQVYEEVQMNEGGPRLGSQKQALTKEQKQRRANKRARRKKHTGR